MSNINNAKTFSGKKYSTEDFVKQLVNLPNDVTTLIDVTSGKINKKVLPIAFTIFQFTNDNVQDNVISIEASQSMVIAIIDEKGKHWQLLSQSVIYNYDTIDIDLTGILAQKNITNIQGTWKIGILGGVNF